MYSFKNLVLFSLNSLSIHASLTGTHDNAVSVTAEAVRIASNPVINNNFFSSSPNFLLIKEPEYNAQDASMACKNLGLELAAITIKTWNEATDLEVDSLGKSSKLYFQSWNGDSYESDAIVLVDGGAVIAPTDPNMKLPVLCSIPRCHRRAPARLLMKFDDIAATTSGVSLPALYNGFTSTQFYAVDALNFPVLSGYQAGMISSPNVGFGASANPFTLARTTRFDMISTFATAAWNDNLTLKVTAYRGVTPVGTHIVILSAVAPTFILFPLSFRNIDSIKAETYGGTHHAAYTGGAGTHVALDNMTFCVK